MSTRQRRYPRRTDLFLVRVWTESRPDTSKPSGENDGIDTGDIGGANSNDEWSGTVQRVVDGEARRFRGWQSLADALLALLSDTRDKLDQ